MSETVLVLLAVVCDLVVGDPSGWPHPVRWLGRGV